MADSLLLGMGGLFIGLVAVTIGYAVGAGVCRRTVRTELWRMFEALEKIPTDDDAYDYGILDARTDVIALIRRLEL